MSAVDKPHHSNGRPMIGAVPRGFKPKRDRAVPSTIVACPDCDMPVDQVCISLVTGLPGNGPHRVRRRLALRKLRDDAST